ncbi:uncharacterized protein CXorf51A-like [Nycticebus coucang]|uniref:uncharacterized protein CXorf51A-like n=1 Tax=Nycticebus coucang TaxID=9470 RepID=UPI00234CA64E|nr:uncharacterized protein CXorf51A-like [Nycticebus coucang]
MTKVTRKPREPMKRPSTSTKGRKRAKTPYQSSSRVVAKVLKTSKKLKQPFRRCSSKKASKKTPTVIRKPKKSRGLTLFGHYHRLNKKLKENEPGRHRKNMDNSPVSSDDLGSQ